MRSKAIAARLLLLAGFVAPSLTPASAAVVVTAYCGLLSPLDIVNAGPAASCTQAGSDADRLFPGQEATGFYQANASADLPTGVLRTFAAIAPEPSSGGVGVPQPSSGGATASFVDALTFVGDVGDGAVVRFDLLYTGAISGPAYRAPGATGFIETFGTGDQQRNLSSVQIDGSGSATTVLDLFSEGAFDIDIRSNDPGSLNLLLSVFHTITDSNRTVRLSASSQSFVSGAQRNQPPSATDFGQTARLAVSLPTGLSFTSESGVLLTEAETPVTPVPLPGAGLLLAAALASFLRLSRRKAA